MWRGQRRKRVNRSAICLAIGLLGCGGGAGSWSEPAAPRQAAGKGDKAPRWVTPARLLVLPERREVSFEAPDIDGSVRLIAYGMRMLRHADGRVEVASQLVPDRLELRPLELPPRLGGGWLFYSSGARSHFWRSSTWLGELEPVATFSADINQVTPGFDRLYLTAGHTGEYLAMDPRTWRLTDLGSLPPAPGYTTMAFAGEWAGAVESDVRGVLVTLDAGASWRPLEVRTPTSAITALGDQIQIRTYSGLMVLDGGGELKPASVADQDRMFASSVTSALPAWAEAQDPGDATNKPEREKPLGDLGLRVAALGGWPDTPETALVMAEGSLARVRLADGELLSLKRGAYPDGERCQGVQVGAGIGFICGASGGRSVVYNVSPRLDVTPLLTFDEPRYITSSGTGGLVVRGHCPAEKSRQSAASAKSPAEAATVSYCIRSPRGTLREVRVRGDLGVERVVALSDGRAAVLVPPRLGAPGTLLLISPDGSNQSHKLRFEKKPESSIAALLKKGLWLDGVVERVVKREGKKRRVLSAWVAGGGPFVGVELRLDGRMTVGELISEDVDRSLLSGHFGLALGRGGMLRETVDGGMSWSDAEVPPAFGDKSSLVPRMGEADARSARGCSPVGCSFGNWIRIGWQGGAPKEDTERFAALPPRVELPTPAGSRWTLNCSPTGEAGGKLARPLKAGARRGAASAPMSIPAMPYGYGAPPTPEALTSSAWLPFLGVAPPAKAATDLALDYGNDTHEQRLRAYAWGPKGADWGRAARWMVRVEDPFAVQVPVWNTAVSRPEWADPVSAAMSFGQLTRWGGYTNWRYEAESGGPGGILVQQVRGTQAAFVLEEDRPPLPIQGNDMWALSSLAGAVRVQGVWYLGSSVNSQSFRIYRLDGSELTHVADFPVRPGRGAQGIQLVRSSRADALGILVKVTPLRGSASRWFIYPVDTQAADAGEPMVLNAETLGASPRPCGAEDEGWFLESEPPVQPYLDLAGTSGGAVRIRAKMIADSTGVCLQALAARTNSGLSKPPQAVPVAALSIPLTLSEQAASGGRWGFRCRP